MSITGSPVSVILNLPDVETKSDHESLGEKSQDGEDVQEDVAVGGAAKILDQSAGMQQQEEEEEEDEEEYVVKVFGKNDPRPPPETEEEEVDTERPVGDQVDEGEAVAPFPSLPAILHKRRLSRTKKKVYFS